MAAASHMVLLGYGGFPDRARAGTAISSGDAGGLPASNINDGSDASEWESSAACTSGSTYIGVNLGTAYKIRKFRFQTSQSASFSPNSVAIQYSDNGTAWTTIAAGASALATGNNTITIADNGTHQWWRLLSQQTLAGVWSAFTLEMKEG